MSGRQIDLSRLLSEPVETRLFYAHDKDCAPEILRVLSKDSFWFVRDFVASHMNTPEECLRELMQDPDFRVRYDAEKTLMKQTGKQHDDASSWVNREKRDLEDQIQAAAVRASQMQPSVSPEHQR